VVPEKVVVLDVDVSVYELEVVVVVVFDQKVDTLVFD
jgi:uncharacterized protein YbcI